MSKQLKLNAIKEPKSTVRRMLRSEIQAHKKKGNIIGYFGKAKRGRPSKVKASKMTKMINKTKDPLKRPNTRVDWSTSTNFPKLKAAADAYMNGDTKLETMRNFVSIPTRTIERAVSKMRKIISEDDVSFEDITTEMIYPYTPVQRGQRKSLIGDNDLKFLQEIIISRDDANNGLGRSEVISLIGEMAQCPNKITCQNHWNYLVRSGKMKELKAGGKVNKAQNTTTKRTQITVEQQLRWHTIVESSLQELYRLNQPHEEFKQLIDYFSGNLDESCLMAANGKIHVVASKSKNKTEKIADDCRDSITTLRTGFASGEQGAYFFLAKGKKLDRHKFKNLVKNFDAPEGSEVIMTPNAFMTDDAWLEIVPKLCRAIRKQKVIKDHPDWWVLLSLDGFGSHVNVIDSHEIFSAHKILVIKEEGDTSHVNQAYDQQVAKDDKTLMRAAINAVAPKLGINMNQWYLITCAIYAQNRIKKESWIDSFKKVNMHPQTRVPFNDWIKKLDDRGFLSADKFFEKRTSLYDAMPACWKRLTVEQRNKVMGTIREVYKSTHVNKRVWTKQNVFNLVKFVKLDDVFKLRGCFLTANIDPSVIIRVEEELSEEQIDSTPVDNFCSWKPSHLLTKYKKHSADKNVQKEFFHHITNYVSKKNWKEDRIKVSDYLDVEMTNDQKTLLKPTMKDVLLGFITYDVKGKGAMQKIAKRKIDFIEGNVNSYSKMLNNPERLEAIKDHAELIAAVAEVTAEADEEKARKKQRREKDTLEKTQKKAATVEIEAREKEKMLPRLHSDVNKYKNRAKEVERDELIKEMKKELKLPYLKQLFMYYYGMKKGEANGKNKPELVVLFADKVKAS
jgi:hypothetical protein